MQQLRVFKKLVVPILLLASVCLIYSPSCFSKSLGRFPFTAVVHHHYNVDLNTGGHQNTQLKTFCT